MSSTVDNRIVQMGFNNKQFEQGVKQSTESLGQLKKSLDLSQSAQGLNALGASGRLNLGSIADSASNVSSKFSALSIIGITALVKLADAAINAGQRIISGFVQPIKAGFEEYETQMNAIQTVLANTEKAGTTLDDVKEALNELNTYADKTIYNFTEMTRNIGTFTAAGVDLDTSVDAIKGIANLAAISGSNSQQAATAMYQLSQALSSGTVKLMDWNSVVNAGMGGQVFQDNLMETARVHGIAIDEMIESEGSFRETLASGWLTSEVLLESLSKFTGDLTEAQLEAMGYNEEQIAGIIRMGETANDAATKVKTFTQLTETLQEAIGSGWTQSWQIILGDFEEAKALFTEISDTLGVMIQASSDSRNAMLQSWKDQGGREAAIQTLRNLFIALTTAMEPISKAWQSIFPPGDLGGKLADITKAIEAFSKKLIISELTSLKLRRIFMGLFSVLGILKDVFVGILNPIKEFIKTLDFSGSGGVLDFLADFAGHITRFRKTTDIAGNISSWFIAGVAAIKDFVSQFGISVDAIKEKLSELREWFSGLFDNLDFTPVGTFFDNIRAKFDGLFDNAPAVGDKAKTYFGAIESEVSPLQRISEALSEVLGRIKEKIEEIKPKIKEVTDAISGFFEKYGPGVLEAIKSIKLTDIIDLVSAALAGGLLIAIRRFVNKGAGILDEAGGIFEGITGILDGVRGSLEAYQQSLKAKTLLTIAFAVGILAAALIALSFIDSAKLAVTLGIITGLFADLTLSMAGFSKFGGGSTQSLQLIGLATALILMSVALAKLAAIDPAEMTRGLGAITALLAMLVLFSKLAGGDTLAGIKGSAISLNAFAAALLIMSFTVKELGKLDQDALKQGLLGLGAILAEVAIFMRIIGEGSASTKAGVAMVAMAGAILVMSLAVAKFGNMDVETLQQGLLTLAIIFAEIAGFTRLVGDGKQIILTAVAMTIMAGAMSILIGIIERLGKLSWEEIAKGLVGMGGALLLVAAAMRVMPKGMLLQSVALVIIAGALKILGEVIEKMGKLDWAELGKGLLALAGSLLIITVALYAMSGTLAGSAALLVAAVALTVLAGVLKTLGRLKISEILLALGALAGIFILLGIAGIALTPLVPTLLGLGASMLLLGAGAALIGAGLFLFATGLGLVAASGVAAALAIVGAIKVILGIIPLVITTLVDAIVIFGEGVIRAAPVVAEAIKTLLLEFMQIIIDTAPKIGETLGVLLDELIKLIRDHIPDFVEAILDLLVTLLEEIAKKLPEFIDAGFDILIGFLEGISENIGEVVTVAVDIVTEFIDAVAEKIPDIIESGWNLMLSFIEGLTTSVEDNLEELLTAIGELAASIIDGLVRGLANGAGAVIDALVQIAIDAWNAAVGWLWSRSPSKRFMLLGETIPEGMAIGIKNLAHHVPKEVEKVAKNAVNAMSEAISFISDGIESDMILNPQVSPVVDMTDIIASGMLIDELFGKKSIELASVASGTSKAQLQMVDNNGNPVEGNKLEFNQYNYSPKALSRIEIYRQTRNQLRGAKGLLNK